MKLYLCIFAFLIVLKAPDESFNAITTQVESNNNPNITEDEPSSKLRHGGSQKESDTASKRARARKSFQLSKKSTNMVSLFRSLTNTDIYIST